MSQKILDYRSPSPRPPTHQAVVRAACIAAAITVMVNAGLMIWAAFLLGWGALLVLGAVIPINLLFILLTFVFIPYVRRAAGGAPVKIYLIVGILTPAIAFGIDCVCISAMPINKYDTY